MPSLRETEQRGGGRLGIRSGLMAVPRAFEWATQRFAAGAQFHLGLG